MANAEAKQSCEPALSGHFLRSIGVMVLGTGTAHAVAVLLLPIIMRLYGPNDFGVLASCVSVATIMAAVSSLSYQRAIPLSRSGRRAGALICLCGLLLGATTALTILGLAVMGQRGAEWITSQEYARYRWFIPGMLLILGVQEILTMWSVRERQFGTLARSRLVQGLAMVVAQLGMGVFQLSALGLLCGDALARCLAVLTLGGPFLEWWRRALSGIRIQFHLVRSAATRYRQFAIVSTPSFALNRCASGIPILLLATWYGPMVAGWWGFAERVMTTPIYWLGDSVAQVYLAEVARLRRSDPRRLRRLFLATALRLFLLGVGPLALVSAVGPIAFSIAFGSEWREAGCYAQWLSLSVLMQFTVSPLSHTLIALERQTLQLLTDVVLFVLRVGSLAVAALLGLSAAHAISVYVVAQGVGYAAQFGLLLWVLAGHAKSERPPAHVILQAGETRLVVPVHSG